MRVTTSTTIRFCGSALAAAIVLAGCTQYAQSGFESGRASLANASSLLSLASLRGEAVAVHTTSTVSLALDRIDQRAVPLDNTYRHRGTGQGVTVYVFDGGVSGTHPELAGRVRLGYTAFPKDPKLCNAHGTAVAGAIAGTTLGVAPDAEIVDVKMVECGTLRGTIRAIVEGAKWAVQDHAVRGGPAIANWSFIADTIGQLPALDSAVAMLRAAGIPVIVSAGNVDVNACRVSPANAEGSIVVGASAIRVDTTGTTPREVDLRAPGTAWGPCIDLFAPGDSVLLPSLDPEMRPISQAWRGTSMSAGYVSGAAALFLELVPDASPDQVAEYLERTATSLTIEGARSPLSRLLYVGLSTRNDGARPRTVGELLDRYQATAVRKR